MIEHILVLIIMKINLLEELIWVDLRGFGLGCWLDQFKHYGGTSERQTGCFKIVKLQRIDKLFTDLIFAYFTMLEALFNFPRWMNLFGFSSVSE